MTPAKWAFVASLLGWSLLGAALAYVAPIEQCAAAAFPGAKAAAQTSSETPIDHKRRTREGLPTFRTGVGESSRPVAPPSPAPQGEGPDDGPAVIYEHMR